MKSIFCSNLWTFHFPKQQVSKWHSISWRFLFMAAADFFSIFWHEFQIFFKLIFLSFFFKFTFTLKLICDVKFFSLLSWLFFFCWIFLWFKTLIYLQRLFSMGNFSMKNTFHWLNSLSLIGLLFIDWAPFHLVFFICWFVWLVLLNSKLWKANWKRTKRS